MGVKNMIEKLIDESTETILTVLYRSGHNPENEFDVVEEMESLKRRLMEGLRCEKERRKQNRGIK